MADIPKLQAIATIVDTNIILSVHPSEDVAIVVPVGIVEVEVTGWVDTTVIENIEFAEMVLTFGRSVMGFRDADINVD